MKVYESRLEERSIDIFLIEGRLKILSLSRKYKDLFNQMFRSMKILLHIQMYEVIIHKTDAIRKYKIFSEQQNIQILFGREKHRYFFVCEGRL